MASRYVIVRFVAAAAGAYLARRKGRNWGIWCLLCFVFPPLFLILLILPRALSAGITKRCPECGRIIPHGAVTCGYCKRELPIEMVQCPRCGKFIPEGHRCPDCGR